mmetsp:Transcript_31509/g.80330  ORF Transcript_31509/g.80330 Transcript_31509/m.80330 type:complete len:246 (+) Transcript_31509:772-1509(+)
MRETDPVLAVAEDPQLARGSRLHHVRQEKRVTRTIHLVRSHGDGHELVAAGFPEQDLASSLGGRVLLHVRLLRQTGQVCLREPIDVAAVEACARRRRHHNLGHLMSLARVDHMLGAAQVHILVELPRVERTDRGADMPHAVGALAGRRHALRVAQVALNVLDARVLPGCRRLRQDVEGHYALRAPLDQHLHQPLPDESAGARHHTVGGDRRMRLLRRCLLQRRQCRRCRHRVSAGTTAARPTTTN